MPGTPLEILVRDHFHELHDNETYGAPVLPSIVTYLKMFLDDDAEPLMFSRAERETRAATALGITDDLVFLLEIRVDAVDERNELHFSGTVLPSSALTAVRFMEESTSRPVHFGGAEAIPSLEVQLDGVEQPVRLGGADGLRLLRTAGEDSERHTWGRLFRHLR